MADALAERRRPAARFFCHSCNVEFEEVLQDYSCPYCSGEFIEQMDCDGDDSLVSTEDFSDADMSNIDDADDNQSTSHPILSDVAIFVSNGRLRATGINPTTTTRPESLFEQLVWTIGDNIGGALGAGAVTAGAPFVLVGAPGDFVFGREGLDVVMTQLLGQLENTGPPPLPREQIAAIPREEVTAAQAEANTSCSVCWENFKEGERISRLECDHIFHCMCIEPWLQLHATCPICRRLLITAPPDAPPAADGASTTDTTADSDRPQGRLFRSPRQNVPTELPRVFYQRMPRRRRTVPTTWTPVDSSSSRSSATSIPGRVWIAPAHSTATSTNSSTSLNSTSEVERQYNMDIDYD